MGAKETHRRKLIEEIDALEQRIIQLNEVACQKGEGLTPSEFCQLEEVKLKETLMKKLDAKCDMLHRFFPAETHDEAPMTPTEQALKEVLY